MQEREAWLAESMLELADSLTVGEPGYLHNLIQRLTELLERSEIGLLVETETGSLATSAASTSRVGELLAIEMRFKEGPGTACHGTGQRLPPQSLDRVDDRWPRFGPAARKLGFASVSALPIRRDHEPLGAVTILSADPVPTAELRIDLAGALIEAAAIGLTHQQQLRQSGRRIEQLQNALDSRVLIEQAKGIVAARKDVSPDAAFELLRGHARRNGRRLREVADNVVRGRLTDVELTHQTDQPRGGKPRSG